VPAHLIPTATALYPPRRQAPVDASAVIMEDVAAKLALLDYETEFCAPKDITPFSRVHFAIPPHNAA
jgi:hypothetical protein